MTYGRFVSDHITPATGIVRSTDPLCRIRQYAGSSGCQSIIVLDEGKPVGLIRWPDIDRANIPEMLLARDLMLVNSPVLTRRTSLQEARTSLDITQTERLPVIDNQGELIGVFVRESVEDTLAMDEASGAQPGDGRRHGRQIHQAFNVYPGMQVYSAEGTMLGLVDRLFLEAGAVSGFLVAHGEARSSHKYLGIDAVERMLDATVTLSMTEEVFFRLPDADPAAL